MKKLIIIAVSLFTINVFAQTDAIDEQCTSYDKMLIQAEEEAVPIGKMKVSCQLVKRAIGPVDHEITIYFDEHETIITQDDSEQEEFLKEAVIRKVEFEISSVSYKMKYAYYFDEGGLLVKVDYVETGYECYHKESYFKSKTLIRVKQTATEGEDCQTEEKAETYDHTSPTKEEKAAASWHLADADKFRLILFNNYELMKN
ncbi:hypothetical protein K6119_13915 [Paracrocinitomix mangrovi]|uniref:hypothetical protein n=1 Tax=Paracrocinitomix mangrovi TaxID=2862509 RepID=UPI001C8EF588|nr:hypothetical protein [Paracrocinitomix mangrovi]UKN00826.1 hypothetical protein K6119_13915 [Paracrocinitomix mangrovi]